jgi:polysaccharide deacetylase family protein (PEP-CTERM system associated)
MSHKFNSAENSHAVVNAMSVDVEDYFQVSAFENVISRSDWERVECRVEANTNKVLDLFEGAGVKGTFFTLGWVAERYPAIVKRIVNEGHELASHGYGHERVITLTPDSFRHDIRRTKALLEDIGGVVVKGYRAPSYSISTENLWAHDVLGEEGYLYSSSVYPVRHDLYGIPDAPRYPYRTANDQLTEIPISTFRSFGKNFPIGGGGYFRLLPYSISKYAIRGVNRTENQPCVFYFHPWEIDPGQPKQSPISFKTLFRHYLNLERMESRLQKLLSAFKWDRMDRVYQQYLPMEGNHSDV